MGAPAVVVVIWATDAECSAVCVPSVSPRRRGGQGAEGKGQEESLRAAAAAAAAAGVAAVRLDAAGPPAAGGSAPEAAARAAGGSRRLKLCLQLQPSERAGLLRAAAPGCAAGRALRGAAAVRCPPGHDRGRAEGTNAGARAPFIPHSTHAQPLSPPGIRFSHLRLTLSAPPLSPTPQTGLRAPPGDPRAGPQGPEGGGVRGHDPEALPPGVGQKGAGWSAPPAALLVAVWVGCRCALSTSADFCVGFFC